MKITARCCHYNSVSGTVDLPVESWDEVEKWYVKWGVLFYCLKKDPETWLETDLCLDALDGTGWKRPISTGIFKGEGYEELLADDGTNL